MSKIRQNLPAYDSALDTPAEGDLAAWVIFTQLKDDGPFLFAGWLDAADETMAMNFAREHYGQDQPCVAIWAIERGDIVGTDLREPDGRGGETRPWIVLTQAEPGDIYRTPVQADVTTVEAASSAEAIATARAALPNADALHGVWVVPKSCIVMSAPDALIWRHVDQGYRLARGYSKIVRSKWETIREQRAIDEYEKDDLKEAFVDS